MLEIIKVADFLYEYIFTKFKVPREIVTDQGVQFTSNLITELMNKYMVHREKSLPYHPQAKGLVEITNKEIESILTKTIALYKQDWATRLLEAIWAYRTTWKRTIGFTPFDFLYGKLELMPIDFQHKTL